MIRIHGGKLFDCSFSQKSNAPGRACRYQIFMDIIIYHAVIVIRRKHITEEQPGIKK